MLSDPRHFTNWGIFKLIFSKIRNLDHEKDLENKMELLSNINNKFNFVRNSLLMVINEHIKFVNNTQFKINLTSNSRLKDLAGDLINFLIEKLNALNQQEKILDNDLKHVKS
jgi:hypothetical protein